MEKEYAMNYMNLRKEQKLYKQDSIIFKTIIINHCLKYRNAQVHLINQLYLYNNKI